MDELRSLFPLRDRLLCISRRELDDRSLTPGEATVLVGLIDAAVLQVEEFNDDTATPLIEAVKELRNG